jgi:hypothetical protein
MRGTITQREKLERFDGIVASERKLGIAMFDLVNRKFGKPIRLNPRDWGASAWASHTYTMQLSMRAEPLFLVIATTTGQLTRDVEIYTDSDLHEFMRHPVPHSLSKMLWAGRCRLIADAPEVL